MELQNLMLTIALAKINVVCANILDHADLERKLYPLRLLKFYNPLIFCISFPKIKMACNKITILLVEHHDTLLRLGDNVGRNVTEKSAPSRIAPCHPLQHSIY